METVPNNSNQHLPAHNNYFTGLFGPFSCLNTATNALPSISQLFSSDQSAATTTLATPPPPPAAHQQIPSHVLEMLKAPSNYYSHAANLYAANTGTLSPPGAHQGSFFPISPAIAASSTAMFFNNYATQFLSSTVYPRPSYLPTSNDYFQQDYSSYKDAAPLASRSEIAAAVGECASSCCLVPSITDQSENNNSNDKNQPIIMMTESEMALAAISDDYSVHYQHERIITGPPVAFTASSNSSQQQHSDDRQKRKYVRRKGAVTNTTSAPVAASNKETPIIVTKPDSEAIYLARFLTTSRDLPLLEVLREYSEHITIKWRRFVSSDGHQRDTIQPVLFTCHVAECCFATTQSSEIVKHMRTSNDCDQCPRRFHTRQQLEMHYETSHRVEIEQGGSLCDDCGLSFRNDNTFTHHKQYAHFICPVCFLKTANADELTEHLLAQHDGFSLKATCAECGAKFMTAGQLCRHRDQTHQVLGETIVDSSTNDNNETVTGENNTAIQPKKWANQRVKCQLCNKMLSVNSMRIHLRRNHYKEKRFKCEFCDYESFDTFMLKEHTSRHLAEYKYHCEFCDFASVKKYQLQSHMRRHTGEKPFRCDKCNFSASWNVQLKDHMGAHTAATAKVCERCNIYFKSQRGLDKHIALAHLTVKLSSTVKSKRQHTARRVKLVKTAVDTKVDKFTPFFRQTSMQLRSRTAAANNKNGKENTNSPNNGDVAKSKSTSVNCFIVNRTLSNSNNNNNTNSNSLVCRCDELMSVLCQDAGSQFSSANGYVVLPNEML